VSYLKVREKKKEEKRTLTGKKKTRGEHQKVLSKDQWPENLGENDLLLPIGDVKRKGKKEKTKNSPPTKGS